MNRYHRVLLYALISILVCCISSCDTDTRRISTWTKFDWPMSFHDSSNSGTSALRIDLPVECAWTFSEGPTVVENTAVPILYRRSVLFCTHDGTYKALNISNGEEILSRKIADSYPVTNACAAEDVFFLSFPGMILAYSVSEGTRSWSSLLRNMSTPATPLITDGEVIVFGTNDSLMCMLSVQSGKQIWTAVINGVAQCSPCIDAKRVYIASGGTDNPKQYVYGLSRTDGRIQWKSGPYQYTIFAGLVQKNGNIYFGSGDRVYCIRSTDGRILWSHRTSGSIDTLPLILSDRLIVGSNYDRRYGSENSIVRCINIQTRKLEWELETKGLISTPLVAAENLIAFGTDRGSILFVKPSDGTVQSEYTLPAPSDSVTESVVQGIQTPIGIALSGNRFLISTEQGFYLCLSRKK